MPDLRTHNYEEIREVVVDVILRRVKVQYDPSNWQHLSLGVKEVLARRAGDVNARVHYQDGELVRDVFWDLFRQGFITLGLDEANSNWPWFRLSHFGQKTLASQNPLRFHDTTSFIALVRKDVPDITDEAVVYLEEAVAAFYAGCLLAACVMLGVAAEAEFLRVVKCARNSPTHGSAFAALDKETLIAPKIRKFQGVMNQISRTLPDEAVGGLEANFLMIQQVLRVARNEAGHPSAAAPNREQVYVFLQLFVPFAKQLKKLREALRQ